MTISEKMTMIAPAKQTTDDATLIASIPREFPIASQTSIYDKTVLLKTRDIFHSWPGYNYLEVGSFLGGSIAPFCADDHCKHILSIDDRGRNQPDERGLKADYTAITSQMMLDNLTRNNLPVEKVETFDGSITDYLSRERSYELMMVDGEHTNWACFRDFIHGQKLLTRNAIVMFHDTSLIFVSLKIIRENLLAMGVDFLYFKERRSDISFILLNDYAHVGFENLFDRESDLLAYEQLVEHSLARHFVRNKTRLPKLLVKLLLR